jgi:LacI family transcriptional regulator
MAVSLLAIARRAGLSKTTVSRALRGSPLVRTKTRSRIKSVARLLGYTPTPLIGVVMASLRRARHATFAGNFAVVFVPGPRGFGDVIFAE